MTDKQLDDLFKKRLGQYSSSVPDDMWTRIVGDQRDPEGFGILMKSLPFLLILFIGFVGWYLVVETKRDEKKAPVKTNNEKQTLHSQRTNDVTTKKITNDRKPDDIDLNSENAGDSNDRPERNKQLSTGFRNLTKRNGDKSHWQKMKTIAEKVESAIDGNSNIIQNSSSNSASMSQETAKAKSSAQPDTSLSTNVNRDANEDQKDEKKDVKDKISVELFASPQVPINNIHSVNSYYENELKNAISSRFSYNIGGRVTFGITSKLSAKVGLVYDHINEKAAFMDSTASANRSYNNRYSSFSVPLLLSYKFISKAVFDARLTAGVEVNIHSSYKGAIPSVFGEALDLKSRNVYNTTSGVRVYVSVALVKQINNRFYVFAEPYLRVTTKNMADHLQPFTHRINSVGVSLGLKYELWKANK
jgi:hypothetical protein